MYALFFLVHREREWCSLYPWMWKGKGSERVSDMCCLCVRTSPWHMFHWRHAFINKSVIQITCSGPCWYGFWCTDTPCNFAVYPRYIPVSLPLCPCHREGKCSWCIWIIFVVLLLQNAVLTFLLFRLFFLSFRAGSSWDLGLRFKSPTCISGSTTLSVFVHLPSDFGRCEGWSSGAGHLVFAHSHIYVLSNDDLCIIDALSGLTFVSPLPLVHSFEQMTLGSHAVKRIPGIRHLWMCNVLL